MNIFQSIILGLLQGITELFPISSLGHSILLPAVFHWSINQNAESFLVFLVATHFATALVLLVFFWKDWFLIIRGIFKNDAYGKLGWLIVMATIPAGALGFLFQDKIKNLFVSPVIVAVFLILNGVMLYGAEKLRRNKLASPEEPDHEISKLNFWQSFKIGTAQAIALLPGFSRTGSSLGGGLASGLSHEAAARFSFLLATPLIFAAAVLKLPELFRAPAGTAGATLAGFISSALAAYLSVRFLTRYFKTKTLTPFAYYCVLVGILCLILLSH